MHGEKDDGQDEGKQRGEAMHTICDPGQGDGGALEAPGKLVRAFVGPVQHDKWLTRSLKTARADSDGHGEMA